MPSLRARLFGLALCAAGLGCTSDGGAEDAGTDGADAADGSGDDDGRVVASDFDAAGPHAVGTVDFEVPADPAEPGGRHIRVRVWYPAELGDDAPVLAMPELEPEGSRRAAIAGLLADADDQCVRDPSGARAGATPIADERWPVVLFSHCHDCVRWEAGAIAERLASHGIAVVAPDHTGNTLFNRLEGAQGSLSPATLDLRVADMSRALDLALDAEQEDLASAGLAGRFDASRVGMIGHSFGAMTLGRVLQDDDRVVAGMAIAAPLVVFPGTDITAIDDPVFSLRALEDNSIGEPGNAQIENQYEQLGGAAWLADVADTGHWSFFDIAGLDPAFAAGCGEGQRQTDPGVSFSYLDTDRARGIAAAYAARFFAFTLLDAPIEEGLSEAIDDAVVEVRAR